MYMYIILYIGDGSIKVSYASERILFQLVVLFNSTTKAVIRSNAVTLI